MVKILYHAQAIFIARIMRKANTWNSHYSEIYDSSEAIDDEVVLLAPTIWLLGTCAACGSKAQRAAHSSVT